MYRVVLIDVMYGQGFCPAPDEVVFETTDLALAFKTQKEYKAQYPWHKVVVQQAIPSICWEPVEN